MFKPLAVFVGLRYTRAKRRNHFISFISMVSMIGLTLGVMVLITVLSVMNGFDRELRQRILGVVPHGLISSYGPMQNWQQVADSLSAHSEILGVAPYIEGQGMLTSQGVVRGVLLTGVSPTHEAQVSIVADNMNAGALADLKAGEFGIVLGEILASRLRVSVGDKVTLVLPEASLTPAGVFPRLKRFTVKGIFEVGAELDANLALTHISDASRIFKLNGGVHGVRLKMQDLFVAPQLTQTLARNLSLENGDYYYARDWTRSHGNLFEAIKMEKTLIALLLVMIVAVAAFNILATLVMVVTDKQTDVAILRTMGATPATIMRIFVVQGSVIGIVGTLMGAVLGVALALSVTDVVGFIEQVLGLDFLPANVYFISDLPSELRWDDVSLICSASLIMSFLATIYPAYQASRIHPAEALRYE